MYFRRVTLPTRLGGRGWITCISEPYVAQRFALPARAALARVRYMRLLERNARASAVSFNGDNVCLDFAVDSTRPNRLAMASAAISVASPSRAASRVSISFLNGVPWQKVEAHEFGLMIEFWARGIFRCGEVQALRAGAIDVKAAAVRIDRTYSRGHYGPPKVRRATRLAALGHPTPEATTDWRPGSTVESREFLAWLGHRLRGLAPDAPVWADGRPRNACDLQRPWRSTLERAGVAYREPEQLRHIAISILASRGAPLVYLAQTGGHSLTELGKTYARWVPQLDEMASSTSPTLSSTTSPTSPTTTRRATPAPVS